MYLNKFLADFKFYSLPMLKNFYIDMHSIIYITIVMKPSEYMTVNELCRYWGEASFLLTQLIRL